MEQVLGSGSYGRVYKCIAKKTGEEVAIKIPLAYNESDRNEKRFLKKITRRGDPDKVHIIKLIDTIKVRGVPSLVLEFLPLPLDVLIRENDSLELPTIRCLGIQLYTALDFLKSCGIVHGDIKPNNVMVASFEEVLKVKLIDLGGIEVSRAKPPQVYSQLTTQYYRAPEVIMGLPASFPIDIWAVTVLLVKAFIGREVFPAMDNWDLVQFLDNIFGMPDELLQGKFASKHYYEVFDGVFSLKEHDPPRFQCPLGYGLEGLTEVAEQKCQYYKYDAAHFKDFVDEFLVLSPTDRPDAKNALKNTFFTMDHFPFDDIDLYEDDIEYEEEALKLKRAL